MILTEADVNHNYINIEFEDKIFSVEKKALREALEKQIPADAESEVEDEDKPLYCCSRCGYVLTIRMPRYCPKCGQRTDYRGYSLWEDVGITCYDKNK